MGGMNRWWHSYEGKAPEGPYDEATLARMVKRKQIEPEDLLCLEGDDQWEPAWMLRPDLFKAGKVRVREGGCLGWALGATAAVCALLGVASFVERPFIAGGFWGLMIVLLVVTAVVERKRWICGFCGNRVERTSLVCPACQGHLKR
jgi:hypothetical protein